VVGTNSFLKVLPEMVTFVRVAERGSFSAAADLLGITPSAAAEKLPRSARSSRARRPAGCA